MGTTDEEVIITTEVLAKESTQALQSLGQSIYFVSQSIQQVMSAGMRLTQVNIQVRNSEWALIDAQRASVSLSLQRYDLDMRQAELNVLMAERQHAITMRTGRALDVKQSLLNVERATADVQRINYDWETKRWEQQKKNITATEQADMAQRQLKLSYVSVYLQMISTAAQMAIMISLIYAQVVAHIKLIATQIASRGIASMGATLAVDAAIVAGAAGIAGGMAYYIHSGTKEADYGTPPSSSSSTQYNINVQGNMDTNTVDYMRQRESMGQYGTDRERGSRL